MLLLKINNIIINKWIRKSNILYKRRSLTMIHIFIYMALSRKYFKNGKAPGESSILIEKFK